MEYLKTILYGIDSEQTNTFTVSNARDDQGRTGIHACILKMLELDKLRTDMTRIKEKHFQKPRKKTKREPKEKEEDNLQEKKTENDEVWDNGILNEAELRKMKEEEDHILKKLENLDECFNILLSSGANINMLEQGQPLFECKAPLHHVVEAKNLYHLEYILKRTKGLNLNYSVLSSKTLLTPLILAASLGHTDIVATFISYGINMKIADVNGWTPLHHAVATGTIHDVRSLVIAGAPRDVKTIQPLGLTPADIAKQRNRLEIFYFLKTYVGELPVRPGRLLDHLIDRYEIKVPDFSVQKQCKKKT